MNDVFHIYQVRESDVVSPFHRGDRMSLRRPTTMALPKLSQAGEELEVLGTAGTKVDTRTDKICLEIAHYLLRAIPFAKKIQYRLTKMRPKTACALYGQP